MEELVYLNGALVPRSQSRISPFDYGFLYGYGLFETMRAYSGRIFRLQQHLERLSRSARTIGLSLPFSMESLEAAVYDTLSANGLRDARLRLSISAGEGEAVPDPSSCKEPTVFITARGFTHLPESAYEGGYRAIISKMRQNSRSPLSRLKSANYLINILSRLEAQEAGCQEAILLNEKGHIAEGCISNVFAVKGGALLTPDLESGCLPGITREVVKEIAPGLGLRVVEGALPLQQLLEADEAFLTNSVIELVPLVEVDGRAIGSGKPGAVTKKLLAAYRELVARETRATG